MNTLVRAGGAILTGLALVLAFPPYNVWFIALVAIAALTLLTRDLSWKKSGLVGLLSGLGFFVPLLHWTGTEVGPIPWLLLGFVQALFFIPLAIGLSFVQRLPWWPLWAAALWVADEALRARVPYGGFPWGKIAFSQADSPMVALASWGGAPLLLYAVALAGSLIALAVVVRRWRVTLAAGVLLAALIVGPALIPSVDSNNTTTVAVVQGNVPEPGLNFNSRARAVTSNHVEATRELLADVEAGSVQRPDIILWPENSSDISPFHDAQTYRMIDDVVKEAGIPTLVGAVVPTPDEKNVQNTAILWSPHSGPGADYVKRHPQPFGEYIPMRGIAERITSAVKRQPRDHVAGDRVGTFQVGSVTFGDVICFEVGFDRIVRDVVRAGSEFITVQTNNATFNYTPMSEQQLAMSRVRAVEHGRSVVIPATSGISAIIAPDGAVTEQSELFTRQVLVHDIPVNSKKTLAASVGEWPEWILTGAAAGALVWSHRRRQATRQHTLSGDVS